MGKADSVQASFLAVLSAAALCPPIAAWQADAGKAPKPKTRNQTVTLDPATAKEVLPLMKEYRAAADTARRNELVRTILERGPAAARLLQDEIGRLAEALNAEYIEELGKRARQAYLQKLAGLSDEQIRQVQIDRFYFTIYFEEFKPAAEKTSPMVASEWRKPDWNKGCQAGFRRLREGLILPVEQVAQGALGEKRQSLLGLYGHKALCAKVLPVEPVPPKKAPTGLEYPPMDRQATAIEKLQRLERSTIMANTIAGPENDKILMENERLAEDLDVEEARAFQYMNERRLLAGSCATRIAGLLSVAARDHSIDLAEGKNKAEGHFSNKGGFGERTARFGSRWANAEGVGGGSDGPNAVDGLSYGGGHTLGIYGPGAPETGIGRHKGSFTFIYAPGSRRTPWCEDGFFLPPGFAGASLPGAASGAYTAVRNNQCQALLSLLSRRDTWTGKAEVEPVALRFMASYVDLQIDHEVSMMEALRQVGDVCGLQMRLQAAASRLGGISRFDRWAKYYRSTPQDEAARRELERGRLFYTAAQTAETAAKNRKLALPARQQMAAELQRFAQGAAGSVYAEAAQAAAQGLLDVNIPVRDAFQSHFRRKTPILNLPVNLPEPPEPAPAANGTGGMK